MPRRKLPEPEAPGAPRVVARLDGPELPPHFEHRAAVDMLNSIKVLGPDLSFNSEKTKARRLAEFGKLGHILEDYAFCEESGRVIRIK